MSANKTAGVHVLILGTADWDATIKTNQHYVARELSRSFHVSFVEGSGLRGFNFSKEDVLRAGRRVRRILTNRRTRSAELPVPRPVVLTPRIVPIHLGITYPLNRQLLRQGLRDWISWPGPKVLWAFTPLTYGLDALADAVVYHLVDLLHENPGAAKRAIHRGEIRLSSIARVGLASSSAIESHLNGRGFADVRLVENVADTEVFRAPPETWGWRPAQIIFSGNLTPTKVDIDLLEALAAALRPDELLVLVGPVALGAKAAADWVKRLFSLPNTLRLPAADAAQLAEYYQAGRVGIAPYKKSPLTSGIFPLKTYEYLAAGMPVVGAGLPAMHRDGNDIFVEDTVSDFVDRTLRLLRSWDPKLVQGRIQLAQQHSWTIRGGELRDLITGLT